jgi:hypothetical protein
MTACGQHKNVPGIVKQAFNERFSNAKNVDWEQEEENEWEAEFKEGKTKYSATFDNNGQWLETEYEIDVKSLPAVVKEKIMEKYGYYEIEEVEMAETPENGSFYALEIESGENKWTVFIDNSGKIIKEEKIDNDDDRNEK